MNYRNLLNKYKISCNIIFNCISFTLSGELKGIDLYLYFQTGEGVSDYREAAWIFSDDADVGEQISEQSEGFNEQQEGELDPTLPVESVDPVTTSSSSTYPLHPLDDSVAKKVVAFLEILTLLKRISCNYIMNPEKKTQA